MPPSTNAASSSGDSLTSFNSTAAQARPDTSNKGTLISRYLIRLSIPGFLKDDAIQYQCRKLFSAFCGYTFQNIVEFREFGFDAIEILLIKNQ